MSEALVFGQQCKIYLSADGVDLTTELCLVDSFTDKSDDMVKEHTPLGVSGVDTIDVLYNGGSITIESRKRNSALSAYMIGQTEQNRGGLVVSGQRGKTPYLVGVELIKYVDGSTETNFYKGLVLHGLENHIAGSKDEYTQKVEGRYKEKTQVVVANSSQATAAAFLIKAIGNIALLSASRYADYKESSSETYFTTVSFMQ